jgi:threonine/homoserine/homoserine lactone efflux protein
MIAYFLRGLVLGGAAAAQPGPLQAFLLSLVSRNGWRQTLPAAFAPLISDGPILIIVLVVLARLPAWLVSALQIGGGIFLLYLAWGAWQTFRNAQATAGIEEYRDPTQTSILKAAMMNLLSPAPYLFWATIAGPILLEGWRLSPTFGLSFLLGFYSSLIGGLMVFIAVFGAAGGMNPRINRALGAVSALALLGFGLYQLANGLGGVGAVFA